ncbi:MAG: hypothetical protein JWQ29_1741 [Phenylobacterium sp.]|nr:hypothetical protein [Phenylobacterium sp.]
MAHASFPEPPSEKPPPPGRRLLFAGVAAAALMGVGLGLWARPAMSERQLAAPVAVESPPAPGRTLQIVVEDTPAPLGAPIEVLPASAERGMAAPPPERQQMEPVAPVRPPAGLVRVQTVEAEPAEPAPRRATAKAAPRAVARIAEKPKPAVKVRPMLQVKAPAAKVRPAHIEKVKAVEKAGLKPQKAKIAKAAAKPARLSGDKLRLARLDRREKPARVEKVEAHRPSRLSGLVHAIARAAPHKAEPAPKLQKVQVERKKPKAAARPPVQKVAVKARPAKAAPVQAIRPARGAGPLRLAKYTHRPDSTISDADRQMSRAYSTARAAGVPDWQLRRQQQRWEAARASAAREAPWAVHDVYLARIAELHDLTRDAQGSGY